MIDSIQNIVQAELAYWLTTGLLTVFGGILAFLNRNRAEKDRLEIEQKHREALHKAINTGIGLAFDTIQKHPAIAPTDQAIGLIIQYVENSVPDALRHLAPSRAHLEAMARAKLTQQLDSITGRDRLSDALGQIPGIEAHNPHTGAVTSVGHDGTIEHRR